MIKAIIFDCFGVLATDELLPFLRQYFDDKPSLMAEAVSMNKQVDSGVLKYDSMVRRLAEMAGIPELEARARIEHNVPDRSLFGYIQSELKPAYKLGLLSNAGENWLTEIFTVEQLALFDETLLSFEVGFTKPDPRIYRDMAQRLAVSPEQCLMIDDQKHYCDGATQVGMQAVCYVNLAVLRTEIERLI